MFISVHGSFTLLFISVLKHRLAADAGLAAGAALASAAGLAAGDGTGRGGTSFGSIQTIVKHSANWSFYHFIY